MKKIFLLVAAVVCSTTLAFAQDDTRTVISECAFTGTPASIEAGQTWSDKWATSGGCFTAVDKNIYHVSQYMYLDKKKDDDSWASVSNNTVITEGVYRYNLQLRIDSDYGAGNSYRLQDDGSLKMTVDGVEWTVGKNVTVMPTFSYVWVFSPEITVEKVTLPLKFTYQSNLDYKVCYINQPIAEKDLKDYTTGGTEEYTYTKTTDKAPWFKVSSAGILSGTPTEELKQAVIDSVKLSDGKTDTIIALYVGPVAPMPADRVVISEASFTNFTTPAVGDINNSSYRNSIINALVRPSGAVYTLTNGGNTSMRKVEGEGSVLMAEGEAFAEGTYRMQGQLRIDTDGSFNGYFYVLDHEDNITATMDGKAMRISSGGGGDTFSYRSYSYEFTIGNTTAIENTPAAVKAAKRIKNGQMVIEKNGKFYNALGVEVK